MDVDKRILAHLSDSSKSFTELARVIVPKFGAKGTLVKHLKDLVKEKKIERILLNDRSTKYRLMPESVDCARSAMDVISLELLMNELEYKTRKGLDLKKIQPKGGFSGLPGLARRFLFKNMPEMTFRLQLDRDTLRIVNLTEPTSKLATRLQTFVAKNLFEIQQKIPMPSTTIEELKLTYLQKWNEIKEFSHRIALKHGLRFLLLAWYDGKKYKQNLMSALRSMEKLEAGHYEDICFLDEINKRCFYLDKEYGIMVSQIYERTDELWKISDPYELVKDAFLWYFGREQELMWLEMALVSDYAPTKLSNLAFSTNPIEDNTPRSARTISYEEYCRMKIPLLRENEKEVLIRSFLNIVKKEVAGGGYSEQHRLAIDLLLGKFGTNEHKEIQENIPSPIMNFQFHHEGEITDFSNQPFVKSFLAFKKDEKKRKWLQKCLLLGFPIFLNIPFDKLGFEVKNIL